MTVYHDLRYFEAAVASVLAQDFSDLELIIVDDGNDQRADIARLAGGDPRIRLLHHAENFGQAAAANHGIAAARAEIIARLDADDIAEPSRIRRLVSTFDQNRSIGLVGTWFVTMTEDGQDREIIRLPTSDLEIRWSLLFFNPFCHSSVAFRRACFEAAGGYRTDLPAAEDYDLWVRMLTVCRAANIAEPLTRYRLNTKGLTATRGLDAAVPDRLRRDSWAELDVPFDPELALSIAIFITGYDIPPADQPEKIFATLLFLLRQFLAKQPLRCREDQRAARRLVWMTLIGLSAQPTAGFINLLKSAQLMLATCARSFLRRSARVVDPDAVVSRAAGPIHLEQSRRKNSKLSGSGPHSGRGHVKVLVLIPTLEVGGAEMDLLRNLPLLDQTRFEIVVCTFLQRGPLASRLIAAGVEIVGPFPAAAGRLLPLVRRARRFLRQLAAKHRSQTGVAAWAKRLTLLLCSWTEPVAYVAYAYFACVRPLVRHLHEGEYDVVHTVLPISYFYGSWANRLATRKPLVMARLSLNWYQETSRLLGNIERRILHPRVDFAVCNSATIVQQLEAEGIHRSKIRLIYNGIDFPARATSSVDRQRSREQLAIGQDDLVLSAVGNLWAYKGHADLLRALEHVADRLPAAWTLLVAGRDVDGNLQRLNKLCAELGLGRHVRFLGERQDISSILSTADIHVSASHTEGFPNNILEAMASRLPVVATAVGGVPELVINGETGLLVPANDPDALGAAILLLAHDPQLRTKMGRAACGRAIANFSVERSTAALAEVYLSAAARTHC